LSVTALKVHEVERFMRTATAMVASSDRQRHHHYAVIRYFSLPEILMVPVQQNILAEIYLLNPDEQIWQLCKRNLMIMLCCL